MEKPYIICHMLTGIDGRLHPSRFTRSPDGDRKVWGAVTEQLHDALAGDAWLVGRVTMQEMAKGVPHAPADFAAVARPHHFARRDAKAYAITIDTHGRVHFSKSDIGGDSVVVVLGPDVADRHLAELAADGISYIVSDRSPIDLPAVLDILYRELGIRRLILEGGGALNNSFLAAGLVDEMSVVVAPGIDGSRDSESIVDGDARVAGNVELSLTRCEKLEHGLVHLTYKARRTGA